MTYADTTMSADATARPGTIAQIGIIGGSGFYELLTDPDLITVDTPYGPPSAPIAVGRLATPSDGGSGAGGRTVAFLPRHGRRHEYPPHRVNYRANLWALHALGVERVLAPCAVGSLVPELTPGTFVVPDQVVDRTWGREHTFATGTADGGTGDPVGPDTAVVHVGFADPYCPTGRDAVLAAGSGEVIDGGTLVVINGPRFSTRAESRWHAAQGWTLVGMTGMPEAILACELALCYTTIAMVTDHDAGTEASEAVSHGGVLAVMADNVERVRRLLAEVVASVPLGEDAGCSCRHALDGQATGWR